jgi:hypothetical protein
LKKIDHNIGFREKRQFFHRKLGKIAENCDHNIDPRSRVRIPASVEGFNSLNEVKLILASRIVYISEKNECFKFN